jgi:hypothetical protein
MRVPYVLLLSAFPAMVGCAGTITGPEGGDAEASHTTSAVVSIERTADATEGSRAEASARFVRVTAPASAGDALRAIGAVVDLPARGACATVASLAGSQQAVAPVVELVDVGTVTVVAEGVETRLSPRQLPDVTDVVSGVVYARATDPMFLPSSTAYAFHVAGSPGFMPIDATATAPGDASEIRIAGEDAGVLVASGATVDLAWSASAEATDDVVYVDVRPNGVRCVLDGAGHGTVATAFFDDAGTLVVHRLHRETLRARGIDGGEVRFDFARSLPYVRR